MQGYENNDKDKTFDFIDDGGLAIFNELKMPPSNEFYKIRNEATASVRVKTFDNGLTIATDFGESGANGKHKSYNGIALAKELTEKKGKELYEFIAGIYGKSEKQTVDIKSNGNSNSTAIPIVSYELKNVRIFDDFSKEELDFWYQKGFVTEATLKACGVVSLKSFERVSILADGTTKTWSQTFNRFAFGFPILAGRAYKIYMPKEAYRPSYAKDSKSLNTGYAHLIDKPKGYGYVLGLENLKGGETAYIVAGEADFLAMKAIKNNVFTEGSEKGSLADHTIKVLKQKGIKKIGIVYDTDFAGGVAKFNLKKSLQKEGFESFVVRIPQLGNQDSKIVKQEDNFWHLQRINGSVIKVNSLNKHYCEKPKYNDVCDYLQLFGDTYELRVALDKDAVLETYAKRIGDLSAEKLESVYDTMMQQDCVLNIGTGEGKTTAICLDNFTQFGSPDKEGFLGYIKRNYPDKILVLAAPLAAIVESIGYKYEDLQIVCDGHTNAHKAEVMHSAVTYNSWAKLAENFKKQNRLQDVIFVVDEMHEVITGASYQDCASVLIAKEHVHRFIGLSATIHLFQDFIDANDIMRINLKATELPKIDIEIHNISKDEIADRLLAIAKANPSYKRLIHHNSKQKRTPYNIYALADLFNCTGLKATAIEGGKSIQEKKADKAYTSIVLNEAIPNFVDNVFCTSVLSTGVTLNNINETIIIARSSKDLSLTLQSLARDRKDFKKVHILNIVPKKPSDKKVQPLDWKSFFENKRKGEAFASNYGKAWFALTQALHGGDRSWITAFNAKARFVRSADSDKQQFMYVDDITKIARVNIPLLFAEMYKKQLRTENSESYIKALKDALPNAIFTIHEKSEEAHEPSEEAVNSNIKLKTNVEQDTAIFKAVFTENNEQADAIAEYVCQTTDDEKVANACISASKKLTMMQKTVGIPNRKKLDIDIAKQTLKEANVSIANPYLDAIYKAQEAIQDARNKKVYGKKEKARIARKIAKNEKLIVKLKKQSDYWIGTENDNLLARVKRNIAHLQNYFLRYTGIKGDIIGCMEHSQIVSIANETNRMEYSKQRKAITYNAGLQTFQYVNVEKHKIADHRVVSNLKATQKHKAIIDAVNSLGISFKTKRLLSKLEKYDVNDKNLTTSLKPFFDFEYKDGLMIINGRKDLKSLIGAENAQNFENKFKEATADFYENFEENVQKYRNLT